MSIDNLKSALPGYAKDLKLNLGNVLRAPGLSEQQVWGAALASAIASRNPKVTTAIEAEARRKLSGNALNAAKTAAAVMAMNNVYYRFLSLTSNEEYAKMPANLRMNAIAQPGVDRLDFELYSLAVSVINACRKCVDSHEQQVLKGGASKEMVQATVRIASVVHAIAVTLEAEESLGEGETRAAA
ncbi:carboxymuconolactone decarboxylase family protein [Ferruginivarius sediminum]|uniref:Alkyl hydroperoxide reductase AhpD n=1 Tax=Ferruginivarius sediminum TaxID=2661937 RepID=A0A369TB19_9PROT|nr:carboxymuconolactone decarboxylase family protein [Ferruginivarius sediminum]RDD62523.1 alkyl hydroperoxide reductase [Ferruginivarius sediminum]